MLGVIAHFLTKVSGFSKLPMFMFGWVIFLIAAVIFFGLHVKASQGQLSPKAFYRFCFPNDALKDRSTLMDAVMYSVSKMTKAVVMIGHYSLILLVSGGVSGLLNVLWPTTIQIPSATAVVVFSIVACLVWDFSNFWSHYLQHKVPFLWEIHKVHHSATQLTPFTAKRLHPLADKLDLTIGGVLVGVVFGIGQHLYGFTLPSMLLMLGNINMVVTILALDPLRHSSISLSFGALEHILVSPKMHHLHHSVELKHWDKNMGFAFAIWDRIFGTYMRPGKSETYVYGIGRGAEEDEKYQSLAGAYIDPVKAAVEVAMGKPASGGQLDPVFRHRIARIIVERRPSPLH